MELHSVFGCDSNVLVAQFPFVWRPKAFLIVFRVLLWGLGTVQERVLAIPDQRDEKDADKCETPEELHKEVGPRLVIRVLVWEEHRHHNKKHKGREP